jgi:thymidylate kinase
MRRAHEIADAAARERVLVFGSPPPDGRDLDLLARPDDANAIAGALEGEGFQRRGHELARFAGCSVEPVELIDAGSWGLPASELGSLYDDAVALDGLGRLVRPAPHHAVLILARRVAHGDGALDDKRRARLEAALAEDPDAFHRARAHAGAWAANAALAALERIHRDGTPLRPEERKLAALEREASTERGALRAALAGVRDRAAAKRRGGVVIALSGLDGAGKSSQAKALRDTLEQLGYDVETAWTRINWDDLIWRIGTPLKRLAGIPFALLAHMRPQSARTRATAADAPPPDAAEGNEDPVKRLRESSGLLTHVWLMVIAFANAWSQRRLTRPHLRRGAVVICDRYTLDSVVALRFEYGRGRRFRPQRALISAISPTPRRAYYLDVSAETAFERKREWGVEWLAGHRDLYLEEAGPLKVRVLDGELPREEICAQIAADVWQCL